MLLRAFGAGVDSTKLRSNAGTNMAARAAASSASLGAVSMALLVSSRGVGGSSFFPGGVNS